MDPSTATVIAQVSIAAGAIVGVVAALSRWGAPRVQRMADTFRALAGMPAQLEVVVEKVDRAAADGRDTKALVRVMGDAHPDALWEADADGMCVYSNETYLRLTERSMADTLGYGWINCIAQHDREKVRQEWDAAVEEQREFRLRYAMVSKSGNEFGVDCVARVKRDGNRVAGWVGHVRLRHVTGQSPALRLMAMADGS